MLKVLLNTCWSDGLGFYVGALSLTLVLRLAVVVLIVHRSCDVVKSVVSQRCSRLFPLSTDLSVRCATQRSLQFVRLEFPTVGAFIAYRLLQALIKLEPNLPGGSVVLVTVAPLRLGGETTITDTLIKAAASRQLLGLSSFFTTSVYSTRSRLPSAPSCFLEARSSQQLLAAHSQSSDFRPSSSG